MITLFGFGPAFGLPDPSPFVMKTEVQLLMAGLPYRHERSGPQGAPKGKIPFIEDNGVRIGDSTFIRAYFEKAYGIDLDRGLSDEQRAQAWAIERMLEDHLYFAIIQLRWLDDANFAKGPSHFFDAVPEAVRAQAQAEARERVRGKLDGHGLGRHSEAEKIQLGARSIAALAVLLGDKPYLMGSEPTGSDGTAFGMIASVLTPHFDTKLRHAALAHANLMHYNDRMMHRFYPAFGAQAAA
ncbi:MAG: glutathione S-transferase family protein [Rhizomicrobium sp.]|jgi:glutathione S-transferase